MPRSAAAGLVRIPDIEIIGYGVHRKTPNDRILGHEYISFASISLGAAATCRFTLSLIVNALKKDCLLCVGSILRTLDVTSVHDARFPSLFRKARSAGLTLLAGVANGVCLAKSCPLLKLAGKGASGRRSFTATFEYRPLFAGKALAEM